MTSQHVDEAATKYARESVEKAIGMIMGGISPPGLLRDRAEIAIRDVAGMLFEHAAIYELDADLRAALFDINCGTEPALPEDVRQLWEEGPTSVHRSSDTTQ